MVVKNSIDQNRPKNFMQVGIDVKCMHTNFGVCSLFGFRDIATFKNGQFTIVHGVKKLSQLELAQKIHASRG